MNEWQYLKNSLHLDNYLNSTALINTLESELTEQQRLNEKGCIESKITELEKEIKKTRPVYEKKTIETMLGILKYGSKALDKTLDERKEEIEIIKSKRNDIKKELERLSEFLSDVVENFHRLKKYEWNSPPPRWTTKLKVLLEESQIITGINSLAQRRLNNGEEPNKIISALTFSTENKLSLADFKTLVKEAPELKPIAVKVLSANDLKFYCLTYLMSKQYFSPAKSVVKKTIENGGNRSLGTALTFEEVLTKLTPNENTSPDRLGSLLDEFFNEHNVSELIKKDILTSMTAPMKKDEKVLAVEESTSLENTTPKETLNDTSEELKKLQIHYLAKVTQLREMSGSLEDDISKTTTNTEQGLAIIKKEKEKIQAHKLSSNPKTQEAIKKRTLDLKNMGDVLKMQLESRKHLKERKEVIVNETSRYLSLCETITKLRENPSKEIPLLYSSEIIKNEPELLALIEKMKAFETSKKPDKTSSFSDEKASTPPNWVNQIKELLSRGTVVTRINRLGQNRLDNGNNPNGVISALSYSATTKMPLAEFNKMIKQAPELKSLAVKVLSKEHLKCKFTDYLINEENVLGWVSKNVLRLRALNQGDYNFDFLPNDLEAKHGFETANVASYIDNFANLYGVVSDEAKEAFKQICNRFTVTTGVSVTVHSKELMLEGSPSPVELDTIKVELMSEEKFNDELSIINTTRVSEMPDCIKAVLYEALDNFKTSCPSEPIKDAIRKIEEEASAINFIGLIKALISCEFSDDDLNFYEEFCRCLKKVDPINSREFSIITPYHDQILKKFVRTTYTHQFDPILPEEKVTVLDNILNSESRDGSGRPLVRDKTNDNKHDTNLEPTNKEAMSHNIKT